MESASCTIVLTSVSDGFWPKALIIVPTLDAKILPAWLVSNIYSGKTTILYRFKLNETISTIPTIGFNVETLTPTKGLELTVWDMGGQERMRPLWRMYLRGTDGVMFVVDSGDRERIPEAKEELLRLLDTQEMKNVPLVVIANKQDLPGAVDAKDMTKRLQLPQMSARPWVIHSACATTGEGICESMESLAKMVKEYKAKGK